MAKSRWLLIPAGLLAALLLVTGVLAAPGDHISAADFGLYSGNNTPGGIAWSGTYMFVLDGGSRYFRAYPYTSTGTYTSSEYLSRESTEAGLVGTRAEEPLGMAHT